MKNIWKTTQNALAPSIFIILSIVLKPGTPLLLPWPKKRTIIEIRAEKNAVPRVISCSIRRDQRRASPIRDCPRLLPCADRAWSSMISHVEQRSSRRESRGWFFFLARVVHTQAENTLTKNSNFAIKVEIWTKILQKRCFTLPGRLWWSITFFCRSKLKNL